LAALRIAVLVIGTPVLYTAAGLTTAVTPFRWSAL
jgi:hypothetical protein